MSSVQGGAVGQPGADAAAAGRRRTLARLPSRARLRYLADVTLHLVRRELAVRHRGSVLGWVWSLSPALLQLVVAHFLFTRIIPLGVENYPVFLLVGILSWSWFAGSLRTATGAFEAGRNLVLRPGFPTVLLPLVAVLVELVDYLIALPVLAVALLVTTGLEAEALLLPVLLAIQLVLISGLALVAAPLQVFFRDVRQVVLMTITLGFWLTPIFYGRRQVPESFAFLYDVNPMAQLVGAQRSVLLAGTLPSARALVLVALASAVLLAAASWLFARLADDLPDRV